MALAVLGACQPSAPASTPPSADAVGAEVAWVDLPPTRLTRRGPSTGAQVVPETPEGATEIRIASGGLQLLAWQAIPEAPEPVPGLVYFHGAFSLKPADWAVVQPAIEAGFAVLLPSLRGENGNGGDLELLAGEVDDAVAAIEHLAGLPQVDGDRVYAIGHSVGGALAALVSLRPDARVAITGSVGGIYVPETFQRWSKMKSNRALVRFDPFDPVEGRRRTLGPNVGEMVHPHHAYIGTDDGWFLDNAASIEGPAFFVHEVPGDHASSLPAGMARFLELVAADR